MANKNLFQILHSNNGFIQLHEIPYSNAKDSIDNYHSKKIGDIPLNLEIRECSNHSPYNILYIHGVFGHCKSKKNKKFLDFMTSLGYNTFGIDLFAHGESGGEKGNFKMEELISSVNTASDYITKNYSKDNILVGDSLGGEVAFYSALGNPNISGLVSHCIFLNSELTMDWKVRALKNSVTYSIGKLLGLFPQPIDAAVEAKKRGLKYSYINEIMSDKLRTRYYDMDSFRSIFTHKPDVPVESMNIPVHIITGEKDNIIPFKHQKKAYDLLHKKGVDIDLTILQNSGHTLVEDNMPEFASIIDNWIKNKFG
ncbi:MAG: alpha/beta hydrolase [Nanoarchaeota archaeon]|nr:alpha/beta hydrolase [Nanoarchaeota archaeon]